MYVHACAIPVLASWRAWRIRPAYLTLASLRNARAGSTEMGLTVNHAVGGVTRALFYDSVALRLRLRGRHMIYRYRRKIREDYKFITAGACVTWQIVRIRIPQATYRCERTCLEIPEDSSTRARARSRICVVLIICYGRWDYVVTGGACTLGIVVC